MATERPTWGIWNIPESKAHLLPNKIRGLDVIELDCGTAYVSAWLARLGAHVTAIDNSEEQLKTARALQAEKGLSFELIHGDAEKCRCLTSPSSLRSASMGQAHGATRTDGFLRRRGY